MDFQKLIRARYSVRAYTSEPIADEIIDRVLDAAVLAPTAANRQPFRLIITETAGREEQLRTLYKADWFVQAPYIIAIIALPDESWSRSDGHVYCDVDCAIVMDHLILAAAEEGLGTCWIGAFNPKAARDVFNLPAAALPIAMTPLGYAADKQGEKFRKSRDILIYRDQWPTG